MRLVLILALAIISQSSCNNNANTTSPEEDTTKADTTHLSGGLVRECYAQIGKDTVLLSIIVNQSNAVNGTLFIHRSGKDINQGNLDGKLTNDTLLAEYTFYSEGRQSVREVVFLKKDDAMIEGYGEVEDRNGKMIFKNTGTLKFDDKMKLKKVDCAQ